MPTPNPVDEQVKYAVPAIDLMDESWDRFYDIWLELASKNAVAQHRDAVEVLDVEATMKDAFQELLKEVGSQPD